MSTSFSSSSSSSSSLSSTRLFNSKSPLRGSHTPKTVSQYSFHIVNAAVTGLRTSARLFTGDLILRPSATPPSAFSPKTVIIYARRKHCHLLRAPPLPSSLIPSSLPSRSSLDNALSNSFSQLHPNFRLPPIFTHLLRHRRSNAPYKFAAKLAKLSVELARICAGEMLL